MENSKKDSELDILNKDPYYGINFVVSKAQVRSSNGTLLFSEDVEFPDYFDKNSIAIVSNKYLCNNAKVKETSLKQLVDRVSDNIADFGQKDGYFIDEQEYNNFLFKLKYYQVHQFMAFNSPVYFNVGINEKCQVSACFILEILDNMESIFDVARTESLIFKRGSGSGMNLSRLRSRKEKVNGAGYASGPLSFLRSQDTNAGIIKSGGTLRRSAKFACINVEHPDIDEFIECKKKEEKKLEQFMELDLQLEPGEEMRDLVYFQNTNLSVRVTDDFMTRVEQDRPFWTKYVLNGKNHKKYKARELLMKIAEYAWESGDPGIQYHDNVNKWNTCRNHGEIEASNPCGEFVFLNNSSCNLASINLLKFFYKQDDGSIHFNYELFEDVVKTLVTAQDIIIDNAFYPTDEITNNSKNYRPLGLGYTNLGGLLMWLGLPYDSDEGRAVAAELTALMTGIAYVQSHNLSLVKGEFKHFKDNQDSFYDVMNKHISAVGELSKKSSRFDIIDKVEEVYENLAFLVQDRRTFRNAQTTLLAPTGTISFLMGAVTTGIEPEFSLIKEKNLSGMDGAQLKLLNNLLKESLENLGYADKDIDKIFDFIINKEKCIEDCPNIKKEHIPVFDTSVNIPGKRIISYQGHLNMMAAVQPFLSGALSKTINLPKDVTPQDIYEIYRLGWKLGLKGLTIYRDGSKASQPLATSGSKKKKYLKRNKMPKKRKGEIMAFQIAGVKGYLIPGLYEDGSLGEVFIQVAKEGSTLSGLLDAWATTLSISLQYGAPLKDFVKKLMYSKFEPAGFTDDPDIKIASSIIDYIVRYLGNSYLTKEEKEEIGLNITKKEVDSEEKNVEPASSIVEFSSSAPTCRICGSFMMRKGTCFLCTNCGSNDGACG